MEKTGANYNGLDLGKFIMAVLVVSIHTHLMADCSNRILYAIWANLSPMAVPFFFVTTSWLFFKSRDDIYSEKCREDLRKRICHFVFLYIVWEIIYLPCILTGYCRDGNSLFFNIADYIRKLVFVGSNYYSSQFWFLLAMIYLLIVLLILLKWRMSCNKIFAISCLFYVTGTIINHLIEIRPDEPSGGLWLFIRYFSSLCNESKVLANFIYITLGMIMARRRMILSKGKIALFFVIGVLGRVMFPEWYLLGSMAMLFEVIAVFQIFLQLGLKNRAIYKKLRESSMVLYYSHFYFIFLYELVFHDFSQSGWKLFAICLSCCLLFSIFIIWLKKYQPFSWLKKVCG